jgi:ribose transport system ATP-binding protein
MAGVSLDRIISLMTGRASVDLYPRTDREAGAVILEVKGMACAPRLVRASFELRAGEIFGLAGLIGAGRTDLLRAIFGLDQAEDGVVAVDGASDRAATPRRRWAQGVGFLSENRKEEGLMLGQSIADNITLTKLGAFGRLGWVGPTRQRRAASRWIDELAVRCAGPDQAVGALSGGNQQKVALARLLEHPARILLLDEPTRGIDVGSKAQIYERMGRLAAAGKTVVVVSSYLPELFGLCDRIGVMCRGELVQVKPRTQWTEETILKAALGGADFSSTDSSTR